MLSNEELLKTEYSEKFDKIRKDMMVMSHYKYGWVKDCYETYKTADAMKSLQMRIDKYLDTGNTEYLCDVANFAMIEYMYPQHRKAHYKSTDSNESPGLHGFGTFEIERFKQNSN